MAVVLAAIEFVVAAVVAALAVTAFVAAAAVGLVAAAVAREAAVERTKTLLQSHLGPAFVPSSSACYLAPTFPVED